MDAKKNLDSLANKAQKTSCAAKPLVKATCDDDKTAYENANKAKHTAEDAYVKDRNTVDTNTDYAAVVANQNAW